MRGKHDPSTRDQQTSALPRFPLRAARTVKKHLPKSAGEAGAGEARAEGSQATGPEADAPSCPMSRAQNPLSFSRARSVH